MACGPNKSSSRTQGSSSISKFECACRPSRLSKGCQWRQNNPRGAGTTHQHSVAGADSTLHNNSETTFTAGREQDIYFAVRTLCSTYAGRAYICSTYCTHCWGHTPTHTETHLLGRSSGPAAWLWGLPGGQVRAQTQHNEPPALQATACNHQDTPQHSTARHGTARHTLSTKCPIHSVPNSAPAPNHS